MHEPARVDERGLAQLLGHPVSPRDASCPAKLLLGCRTLTHHGQRIAQREQLPAPRPVLFGCLAGAKGGEAIRNSRDVSS